MLDEGTTIVRASYYEHDIDEHGYFSNFFRGLSSPLQSNFRPLTRELTRETVTRRETIARSTPLDIAVDKHYTLVSLRLSFCALFTLGDAFTAQVLGAVPSCDTCEEAYTVSVLDSTAACKHCCRPTRQSLSLQRHVIGIVIVTLPCLAIYVADRVQTAVSSLV